MRQGVENDFTIRPPVASDKVRFPRASLIAAGIRARRFLVLPFRSGRQTGGNRAFILGCGRSGTTVLGTVLGHHPAITYYFEPQARWAMVDPRTDIWNRFCPWRQGGLVGETTASLRASRRFTRIFPGVTARVLDKSPDGVFRLGFLLALDPDARFVHIVRDGAEAAQSIAKRAEESFPLLAGHTYNGWWGVDEGKWGFLCRVANTRGYLGKETAAASTEFERGLCEWLLALNEIGIYRDTLGDRLLEVKYSDLVSDPRTVLERVASFLEVDLDKEWLEKASSVVRPQGTVGHKAEHASASAKMNEELERQRRAYELA
jgi:hypothetical protein